MTIKELKDMLKNFCRNPQIDNNTEIQFCHMKGFNKIQKGELFCFYDAKKNRIDLVSFYYYYKLMTDKPRDESKTRFSSLEEATDFALNAWELKDFIIMYVRGNTSSVEAVFENGKEVSDKSWIT
tara:strand:+ start:259 stop:633 length:375 start_codon:yes stop_codon:yes gene_type:complete